MHLEIISIYLYKKKLSKKGRRRRDVRAIYRRKFNPIYFYKTRDFRQSEYFIKKILYFFFSKWNLSMFFILFIFFHVTLKSEIELTEILMSTVLTEVHLSFLRSTTKWNPKSASCKLEIERKMRKIRFNSSTFSLFSCQESFSKETFCLQIAT